MSIFNVKQWWTADGVSNGIKRGHHSDRCLRVDKVGTNYESDLILLGCANGLFRIFRPQGQFKPTDLILEQKFNESIIQITSGKFLVISNFIQIAILNPLKVVVYNLISKEGHAGTGDQNILHPILEHRLRSNAYSMVTGHFHSVKNRDLICVQMLNGSFSIFDQEVPVLQFNFSDIVLPIPFAYASTSDCFVFCKTSWIMEIYSYQQLIEYEESLNQQNAKKLVPQWTYNTGEEIYSMQIVQTSNTLSSIVVLGERHLYCMQDNGLLKFVRKLEYTPVCFWAYLIGWYYEPGARLLIMIASDDSKLMIYENTILMWSCKLPYIPIAISKAIMTNLPGGIVTLSAEGQLTCSYLGTEPELNSGPLLQTNENVDHGRVQTELAEAELELKTILEDDRDIPENTDDLIKISIEVQPPEEIQDINTTIKACRFKINIKSFKEITSVQLTYNANLPVAFGETAQIVEPFIQPCTLDNYVYLANDYDVGSSDFECVATITDEFGRLKLVVERISIPLVLLFDIMQPDEVGFCKVVLKCGGIELGIQDLYQDFENSGDSPTKHESISFSKSNEINMEKHVTVKTRREVFEVYATHYTMMPIVIDDLIKRLESRGVSVVLEEVFIADLINHFITSIEAHSKERSQLKELENILMVLRNQFVGIQKRLLVHFGSMPPGNCEKLQKLMNDSFKRIVQCADSLAACKDRVIRISCEMSSQSNLIQLFADKLNIKSEHYDLIKQVISSDCLYEDYQEWEETSSQSISFVLRTIFSKSDKDSEKLIALTDQGILNQSNLRRFLKMLKLFFDKVLVPINKIEDSPTQPTRVMELEEKL